MLKQKSGVFVCGSRLSEYSVRMKSHSAHINIVSMPFLGICLVCCSVPYSSSTLSTPEKSKWLPPKKENLNSAFTPGWDVVCWQNEGLGFSQEKKPASN